MENERKDWTCDRCTKTYRFFEAKQYAWQHFSPEQIISRDGNRITIAQSPFYQPEQWTAVQHEEDGLILAYRPIEQSE